MMRNKKAQAALEFLMTYGWAILVVLIVIGALAYFGVLNPNMLVPEKCTLQTGVACKDYRVIPGQVMLELENGMGKGIVVMNITAEQTGHSGNCTTDREDNITIANGVASSFTLVCDLDEDNASLGRTPANISDLGRKIKLDLAVTYFFQDSSEAYSHTLRGEMLVGLET